MELLDWLVLGITISGIVMYGIWKGRGSKNMADYLSSGKTLPWYTIGLSVIATQASAVTFLSAPGQAYVDGMRFVLFYLGLPLAMIVISTVVIPLYYRLNVITAYEYLESRFDAKTRILTAFFFLIQRGLSAGISMAAPAIVLSVVLGWDIFLISSFIGIVVIIYTVTGGSKAVSQTQKLQMITILTGMGIAGYLVVAMMPTDISFGNAMQLAGQSGKFNTMDFKFDLSNKYNFWSGIIGGFFLQMAYFGTDQSQVGRYLGGKSMTQSRLGLLFNGVFKIPMQFSILFIGAMLFIFYQFHQPPLVFNKSELAKIKNSSYQAEWEDIQEKHHTLFENQQDAARNFIQENSAQTEKNYEQARQEFQSVRAETGELLQKVNGESQEEQDEKSLIAYVNAVDANHIFLTFVTNFLPVGLVGLLIAIILMASMSTTASELNALASTTTVDIYKRAIQPNQSEKHYLFMSKAFTVFWGVSAIGFAFLASQTGALIEVVNILGSLFYGTILGVFLLAFFFSFLKNMAVFIAAILGELVVVSIFFFGDIAYLWLNLVGCLVVVGLAFFINIILPSEQKN